MDNILTKGILTKLNGYLSSPSDMTKPERRCLKDMVTGILKSRSVFVNQIAASLRVLLDAGYNYLNKNVPRELVNFIYYKISKVVSILLMPVRTRWKIDGAVPEPFPGQLNLKFN